MLPALCIVYTSRELDDKLFRFLTVQEVDRGRAISFVGPRLVGRIICLMRGKIHRLAEKIPSIITKTQMEKALDCKVELLFTSAPQKNSREVENSVQRCFQSSPFGLKLPLGRKLWYCVDSGYPNGNIDHMVGRYLCIQKRQLR